MLRSFLIGFLIMLIMNSCTEKSGQQIPLSPKRFNTFEISYSSGWAVSFRLFVDSNKIFFSSLKPDDHEEDNIGLQYGILPDSIYILIDSTFQKIKNDTIIKNKNCYDCGVVAIQVISGIDTTNIIQAGDNINDKIWPLIKALKPFILNKNHLSIIYYDRAFPDFSCFNVRKKIPASYFPLPPKIQGVFDKFK